ncbi:MAG TPA: site-specific integrase [Solirubrobacter sp.]|nr:site-specific integrase [Solirubrobacter sp.]
MRKPGSVEGLTKAQAEKRLQEMIREDGKTPEVAERIRIKEAGAALVQRLRAKGRKKSHVETTESIIRVHLKDAPEFAKDLDKISEDDVERYIARKRRGKGKTGKGALAPKTIRNHLGVLHSIFELGRRKKWCVTNPVTLADGPVVRNNETDIRFLTPNEVDALCRHRYPDDDFGKVEPTLYRTAAMTGLRQSECVGLRWRDIDWTASRIRVVKGYVRGEMNDPKSEGSSRSVPMPDSVAQALARHFDASRWQDDDDLVFCHPTTGGPLDRSKVLKRLRAAEKRAGVRAVTFHELRHTFGTQCAAAGIPMRTIQAWMGHSDLKTTMKYAHYAPSKSEAELVNAAFAVTTHDVALAA